MPTALSRASIPPTRRSSRRRRKSSACSPAANMPPACILRPPSGARISWRIPRSTAILHIEPVIAITSYSNFGEYRLGSPAQIQECITQLHAKYPEILVDGEMHASMAFDKELRQREYPFSVLGDRDVNTIIFPNLSSGSVGLGMLQELGSHEIIGPILLGMNKPVHILAVSDAQQEEKRDMCRI